MKKLLIILFVLLVQKSFCQKKFNVDLLYGFGFNNNLTLVGEELQDYTSQTVQLNLNYRFSIFKELFIETGVGTQWYFSSGTLKVSDFTATSLRLKVPLLIGYSFFKKSIISAGVALANNEELDELEFKANYNLRASFLLKGNYTINNNLDLIFLAQKNLSNIPNLFLVNQPDMDFSFGVSYKLF